MSKRRTLTRTGKRDRQEFAANDVPRPDLPTDPAAFYSALINLDEIGPPPLSDIPPALKRLGRPPFARSGFPLMGFLATLYEHVSDCTRSQPRAAQRPLGSDAE